MNQGVNLGSATMARLTNAQALVVEVVRDLLRAPVPQTDAAIKRALAAIGEFTGIDRAYVFRIEDAGTISMTHEWVAPGTVAVMHINQGTPVAVIGAWVAAFEQDRTVWIADVSALPETAPERFGLVNQGVQSVLMAPMSEAGKVIGFLGYDCVAATKSFLEGEVLLLRSVADVVTTVVGRRKDAVQIDLSQRAMRDARNSLQATLYALPDLVLQVSAEGRYIGWHTASPDLLMVPPEQFIGRLIEDVLPPHLAAIARAAMKDAADHGRSRSRRFGASVRGADRWMELTVVTRPSDECGEPPGYVFVERDVTEDHERRKTIERLGELALRTVNLVIVTDAEQRIEWVNPAFEATTGYTLNEIKGLRPGAFLQSPNTDQPTRARIREALAAGRPVRETILNLHKDGSPYWLDLDIQTLRDEFGAISGFVAVETVVSDRVEEERQKRAYERQAEDAGRRLINAVEALPDAFVYYDQDDRLVLCNENYRSFYPLSADVMVPGVRYSDILRQSLARGEHQAAIGREEDWLAQQLAAHGALHSEREQNLADGRWLRVIDKATPDGGRVGLRSDITALKHAERRLGNIIEAADVGTWEWHVADGNTVYNERWASLLGETLASLGATDVTKWQSLTHPDDLGIVEAKMAQVLRRERDQFDAEMRMRHRDGHWVWIRSRGRVVSWSVTGEPLIMAGVHLDDTVRKTLQTELEAERDYLSRLMETSVSGIIVMDENGVITFANHEAEKVLGIAASSIEGELFDAPEWHITAADGGPMAVEQLPFNLVRTTGQAVRDLRHAIVWPDGRRRILSVNAAPLLTAGAATRVVCSVADITDQVRADDALRAALDRAESANRLKSQFVANMSHEIRTPLNGVLGMAELLDDALSDPDHKRMIATIRDSGETLLGVLNDILDMSKIEAGKMEVEELPFVPSELARKVEALHAVQAQEKGLYFSVMMDVDADRPRVGDLHRLLQVLHNLVGNAMKFTERGEVTVAFGCKVGRPFSIEVRDTGIGMTPEQVTRVFEDFEQADGTTTRRFGGTGLGLSIVRRLVLLMGGEINVASVKDQGTTVRIQLPLANADGVAKPVTIQPVGSLAGLRVLIADDNATNRAILDAMLTGMQVTTTMVVNGREAVEAFAPDRFDAVLLDISMPEMDGITALKTIIARTAAAGDAMPPVVAITANAMSHQVQEYLDCGFSAHVAKPFRRQDLTECLRRLVRVE